VLVLPVLMILGQAGSGTAMAASAVPTAASAAVSTSRTTAAGTSTRAAAPAVCRRPIRRGFIPKTASLSGSTIRVLALGRRHRVPLPPPLTPSGKISFAWDKYGPKPGSARGNVRFNAHTYPDGSALGNRLLARLQVGNRIILRGKAGAICYTVTRRVVTARTKTKAYYTTRTSPKLAIVVCSGRRLGPGRWTRRTIWYARPSTR
jgi:hypothetical protein